MEKPKTMYNLGPHETLKIPTIVGGTIEITRVPGGWIYAFDYVGYRQSPIVFVPYSEDALFKGKIIVDGKEETKVKATKELKNNL